LARALPNHDLRHAVEHQPRVLATETTRAPRKTLVPGVAGYAVANSFRKASDDDSGVDTFNQAGQPTPLAFAVAVIC
jgi:hypothetical protein